MSRANSLRMACSRNMSCDPKSSLDSAKELQNHNLQGIAIEECVTVYGTEIGRTAKLDIVFHGHWKIPSQFLVHNLRKGVERSPAKSNYDLKKKGKSRKEAYSLYQL